MGLDFEASRRLEATPGHYPARDRHRLAPRGLAAVLVTKEPAAAAGARRGFTGSRSSSGTMLPRRRSASTWRRGPVRYVERLITSIRGECLDHMIVFGERHLRRVLREHIAYYHGSRTLLGLSKDARSRRPFSLGVRAPCSANPSSAGCIYCRRSHVSAPVVMPKRPTARQDSTAALLMTNRHVAQHGSIPCPIGSSRSTGN